MLRVCCHPSSRCGASTGGATKPNEKMPGKVPITPIVPPILKFRLPTVLITGDLLLLCTTDPAGGLHEQACRGNVKRRRTDAAAFLTACITPCRRLSTITRVPPRLQPPSLSHNVSLLSIPPRLSPRTRLDLFLVNTNHYESIFCF
jgi:hypothetical protein